MERITIEKMPPIKDENLIHLQRYVTFINSRPERKLKQKGMCEHHIYPKSMAKDNNIKFFNRKWNLITLTPREHYIAHMILWKCYGGKMAQAFHLMHQSRYNNLYEKKITARQFERLTNEYSQIKSKACSGSNSKNARSVYCFNGELKFIFISINDAKKKMNAPSVAACLTKDGCCFSGIDNDHNKLIWGYEDDGLTLKTLDLKYRYLNEKAWFLNSCINKNKKRTLDSRLKQSKTTFGIQRPDTYTGGSSKSVVLLNDGRIFKSIKLAEHETCHKNISKCCKKCIPFTTRKNTEEKYQWEFLKNLT